jgi:endo-1,4-beta-xylanase
MRKILALVMCVALLSALAIPAMAAPITITAPKGTPTINGTFEPDVYSDFTNVDFVDNAEGGATGKAAVAWDDDNIYVYIEVNDTTPHHDNDTNWQTDNVEFFFDWANAKYEGNSGDDGGSPFWQARIHSAPGINDYGITGHANFDWDPAIFERINFVVVPLSGSDLSNGYIIEAAFPRGEIEGGFTFAEGIVIGFDITISDAHNDFERHSTAFFFDHDEAGMESNMWENPSALKALLVLGAAPAPVVVYEPEADLGTGGGEPAPVVAPPVTPVAPVAAPQTADPITLIALASLVSAAGIVIAKKRK